MKNLYPTPISAAEFAPFGTLLAIEETSRSIDANQGSARRYDWAIPLENLRSHAKLNVAIFRCAPRPLPFPVVLLERHRHSTQLFVPMDVESYVVLVAGDGEEPDIKNLRAFLVPGTAGIAYAPGVWHHPMIALSNAKSATGESLFSASMWEDGTDDDCETVHLETTFLLTILK